MRFPTFPLCRRRILVLVPVLVAMVSCGDDGGPASSSAPPDVTATLPTIPPTVASTAAGATSYEYGTGPQDVVIEVVYEGGFLPPEAIFTRTPTALVTGDGRVLSTGPVTAIYPGPLLPNVLQQTISPEGIEELLGLADELGLLADVTYPRKDTIADAPDTVVTIRVDGERYSHQAYALDIEPETDEARANLSMFVAAIGDLTTTVGDAVGPAEPFVPEQYLMRAEPVELSTLSFDVEPTIVEWPADLPVRLVDAAECAELPAADAEAVFGDATQLTFFTEADATYQVAVVQQVPGRNVGTC